MMMMARARKFASQAASPTRSVEKEVLREGLRRTRMASRVPVSPNRLTLVTKIPSTMNSNW